MQGWGTGQGSALPTGVWLHRDPTVLLQDAAPGTELTCTPCPVLSELSCLAPCPSPALGTARRVGMMTRKDPAAQLDTSGQPHHAPLSGWGHCTAQPCSHTSPAAPSVQGCCSHHHIPAVAMATGKQLHPCMQHPASPRVPAAPTCLQDILQICWLQQL